MCTFLVSQTFGKAYTNYCQNMPKNYDTRPGKIVISVKKYIMVWKIYSLLIEDITGLLTYNANW